MIQAHEKGLGVAKPQAPQIRHDHTHCLNFKQLEPAGQDLPDWLKPASTLTQMKAARRWLLHKDKRPFHASCKPRSGTLDSPADVDQLVSFTEASAALAANPGFSGLGFALGDGWQGVDLDKLDQHLHLHQLAHDLPGYVERSPSGKGLHAIGRGADFAAVKGAGAEAYSHGRFFTFTGDTLKDGPLVDLAPFVRDRVSAAIGRTAMPALPTTSTSTHDLTEIRSALEAVPPDCSYDQWVTAGMALHAATAGAADGFEMWDQWSSRGAKYRAAEMAGKWTSFAPAANAPAVGVGSLVKMAHEHGWRKPDPDVSGLFAAVTPAPAVHPLARVVSLKDSMKPTRWLIPNLIQEGLVLVAGSPGVGKTTNLLPMLASVAHLGDPANQTIRPPARRKILWITEDSSQAKRIIHGMAHAGWLTLDQAVEWINIVDAQRLPIEQIVTLEPEIRHLWTEAQGAHGPVTMRPLIVFDTLSAVVAVDNENDNAEISKVMAGLKTAFAGYPLVVIAHTSKALKGRTDAREMAVRGASALEGDAHQTMYLVEDDGTRFLVFGKTRFERHESFDVQFTSHTTQTLLSGDFGLEMSTLRWSTCRTVSVQDKIRTREEAANTKKEIQRLADRDSKAAAMVECISANWKSGGAIGRNALYSKISGKRAYLMDALEHLIQTGSVVEFTPNGSRYPALYPLTASEREQVAAGEDPVIASAGSINSRYPP